MSSQCCPFINVLPHLTAIIVQYLKVMKPWQGGGGGGGGGGEGKGRAGIACVTLNCFLIRKQIIRLVSKYLGRHGKYVMMLIEAHN